MNSDGTVSLIDGSMDIGGSRASLAMQLAETLGLTMDDVNAHIVDTDSVGWTGVTGGSRTTFATGWVAYDLGEEIKKQVTARAARMWDVVLDQVTYEDGKITGPDDAEGKPRSMTFKEIAKQLQRTGGLIAVSATSRRNTQGAAFAGHIVDLKVDRETGKVTILRYTAIQDVGRAIHPSYVEGQIQGGAVQGIGLALNEEYYYDQGPPGKQQPAGLPHAHALSGEGPRPARSYSSTGVGQVVIGMRVVAEVNVVMPQVTIARPVPYRTGEACTGARTSRS